MVKKKIKPGPFLVPMPVVLVGSVVDGKPNFMTAAFSTIVNFNPPVRLWVESGPSHLQGHRGQ